MSDVITQRQCLQMEWTIEDINSYKKADECLKSPRFSVPGSTWYLELYPHGETESGWIDLFVIKESVPPKSANYDLGVKWSSGKVEMLRSADSVFDGPGTGYGYRKFLNKRGCKSLTIACTLRVKDASERLNRLSEDFKEMLVSKSGCDTTLKVKNECFPVHRSVLASRSPVLKAMFGIDTSEKNTGVVDITDCDPGAFRDFLTYMYSGQFENSSGDLFELYKIAHKYCVEELKDVCVQFIINQLSAENVIDVAAFADEFADDVLKRESQKSFAKNFLSIASQDKWAALLENNSVLANELLTNIRKTRVVKRKKYLNDFGVKFPRFLFSRYLLQSTAGYSKMRRKL